MTHSTRNRQNAHQRVCKLVWAQNGLRRVRDNITPDVAPRTSKRLRSLLKSIDGAIRNAERCAAAAERDAQP